MSIDLSFTLPQLLKALLDQGGSDLHISANSPPRLRINGLLLPLDLPPLTESNTMGLCYSVLTAEQKREFENHREIDISFSVKGLCRFRANIFLQQGCTGGVFRAIPTVVPSFRDLGLPPVIEELCHKPRGLILVTGPTGSGKSTTLAAMIDYINSRYQKHIVTLEDPIEFVHSHKNSLINQREVGSDTISFGRALRSCLRQDPDVVLVGELRDFETIAMALTTAETGHLVLATLHTNSCAASINRIIDVFPADQQAQVRTQLSFSLIGVLSQLLIRNLHKGRSLCAEVMVPNNAIRNLIREDKVHQIYSAMQIGQEDSKMRTMNQALLEHVLARRVSPDMALTVSQDRQELIELMQKNSFPPPAGGDAPRFKPRKR